MRIISTTRPLCGAQIPLGEGKRYIEEDKEKNGKIHSQVSYEVCENCF